MTAWLPLFVQFVHPDYVRDVIPIRARGANMLFWFSRRGDQRRVGNRLEGTAKGPDFRGFLVVPRKPNKTDTLAGFLHSPVAHMLRFDLRL